MGTVPMSVAGDLLRVLADRYRDQAATFERYGQTEPAALLSTVAKDLLQERETWESAELTLEQAAEESGYSYSTLQRKVASGEISNAGEKHAPRIRRGDLPRKGSRIDAEEEQEDGGEQEDAGIASEILGARAAAS